MQNEMLQEVNDEISLKDIIGFFKRNIRTIVIFGVVGVMLSSAYLFFATKKYEAQWQVQVAKDSEDAASLSQRLRLPTTYTVEVRQICGFSDGSGFDEFLRGMLKTELIKNVNNSVEMKVIATSVERAMKCADAITKMIIVQQSALITEKLAGRQDQLKQYRQALKVEQQQLEGGRKSDLGNFSYLVSRDKLSWLRTRIDSLEEEAMLSQLHPAKLVAPVFVSSKPVSPKKGFTLVVGFLSGLMLGLIYAWGRESWSKLT